MDLQPLRSQHVRHREVAPSPEEIGDSESRTVDSRTFRRPDQDDNERRLRHNRVLNRSTRQPPIPEILNRVQDDVGRCLRHNCVMIYSIVSGHL